MVRHLSFFLKRVIWSYNDSLINLKDNENLQIKKCCYLELLEALLKYQQQRLRDEQKLEMWSYSVYNY